MNNFWISEDEPIGKVVDYYASKFDTANKMCGYLPFVFVPMYKGFSVVPLSELPEEIKNAIAKTLTH